MNQAQYDPREQVFSRRALAASAGLAARALKWQKAVAVAAGLAGFAAFVRIIYLWMLT